MGQNESGLICQKIVHVNKIPELSKEEIEFLNSNYAHKGTVYGSCFLVLKAGDVAGEKYLYFLGFGTNPECWMQVELSSEGDAVPVEEPESLTAPVCSCLYEEEKTVH